MAQARRLPRLRPRATAISPSPITTDAVSPADCVDSETKLNVFSEKRIEVAVGRTEKTAAITLHQARGRSDCGRRVGAHAAGLACSAPAKGSADSAAGGLSSGADAGSSPPNSESAPASSRPEGRSVGNRISSRIDSSPETSMTSRSRPIPNPPVGRQPVLECLHVVLVDRLGLLVTAGPEAGLVLEARRLIDGIVQLAVRVGQLAAGHDHLEAFRQRWVVAVSAGQRDTSRGWSITNVGSISLCSELSS